MNFGKRYTFPIKKDSSYCPRPTTGTSVCMVLENIQVDLGKCHVDHPCSSMERIPKTKKEGLYIEPACKRVRKDSELS